MSRRLILTVIIIFLISLTALYLYPRQVCPRLSCISFPEQKDYRLSEIYDAKNHLFQALYEKGPDLLRVEITSQVSESQADKILNEKILRFKSLYETAPAPYPGEISDRIVCPIEFSPVFSQIKAVNTNVTTISAYLSPRLTYGACSADSAQYRSRIAIFHCPKRNQLVQLEFISPITSLKNIQSLALDKIRCL